MADYKYKIPTFMRRDGNALLFTGDGYLEYYIPEDYFMSDSSRSGSIEGAYVRLLGSFNYRIYTKNDTPGKLMTFNFPTIFMCKPAKIEKKKGIKIDESIPVSDYRILTFYKDDQLVTSVYIDQNIDNVSELFRLHIKTGKIPNTIPYNTLYEYPYKCFQLNAGNYSIHSQAMGLLYSEICRDPKDVTKPFRLSKAINDSMTNYDTISIVKAAKYVSPFAALTSQNLDESIMSAILLSDDEDKGKIQHRESPLERVLTM